MDRSLQFFVSIYNLPTPTDNLTGLKTTDYTVTYDINKYDPKDSLAGNTIESKDVTYNVVQSLQSDGQFINYLGNSTTNDYRPYQVNPEHESDISLASIIDWTQKNFPAMKLNYANLAYHKDVKVYPANRLMVLRRFPGAVNDNLFNTEISPLHTMCTFYDFDNLPLKITFNEKWEQFSGSFLDVLSDVIGIHVDQIPGVGGAINMGASSNLAQDIFTKIAQKLNIVSEGGMPYGDPNIVYDAAVRTADGEKLKSGLANSITVTFNATYILSEINGIDAKAAMLDLIGTATAMGSSNSRFYITGAGANVLSNLMTQMEQGNVDGLFSEMVEALSDIIKEAAKKLVDGAKKLASDAKTDGALNAVIGTLKDIGSTLLKQRYSRYKWRMQGVLGALSGMSTAPWHITMGNPKFPWFTIGNLYIESATLDFGGELAYNDMFTELKVSYTFKNGRPLGANEIQSLFNSGRGRIYDTPDKIQSLYIPKDATIKTPGTEALAIPIPIFTTIDDEIPPVETEKTNDLKDAGIPETPFNNDTEDKDKNLSEQKQKTYTYKIETGKKVKTGIVFKDGKYEDDFSYKLEASDSYIMSQLEQNYPNEA